METDRNLGPDALHHDFYSQKHNNSQLNTISYTLCPPHQIFIVLSHALLGERLLTEIIYCGASYKS